MFFCVEELIGEELVDIEATEATELVDILVVVLEQGVVVEELLLDTSVTELVDIPFVSCPYCNIGGASPWRCPLGNSTNATSTQRQLRTTLLKM